MDLTDLYLKYLECTGVSIDTRTLEKGNMFFALKGDNVDGNRYAQQALDEGATWAVVDDSYVYAKGNMILVDDVLKTLQELASFHRDRLDIPVIGLTGSNGKTTTKELIRSILSKQYRVSATKGNYNNHIGVPITLLEIDKEAEIAIVEMGANHVGEIASLCEMARPDHGLITNIGKAHIEGFGDFEGVLRGKSELYDYLIANDGVIFVNSDDKILANMIKRMKEPVLYPEDGDFLRCELISSEPYIVYRDESGEEVQTQLIGEYNFTNIAAALCVGKYFNVERLDANQAMIDFIPDDNRSQVVNKGSNTIILDAYNANPDSMEAAIGNLLLLENPNKVLILGDMNELGEISEEEHNNLVKRTDDPAFTSVLLCGPKIKFSVPQNPNAVYFEDTEKLKEYLAENPFSKSLILVKASRSIGLEDVVESL